MGLRLKIYLHRYNYGIFSHADTIKPHLHAGAASTLGDPNAEWVADPREDEQCDSGAAATADVHRTYSVADAQHPHSLHWPARAVLVILHTQQLAQRDDHAVIFHAYRIQLDLRQRAAG